MLAFLWLLAALLALQASPAAAKADEATLLLALPRACAQNWANATASMPGAEWRAGTDPCGGSGGAQAWKGVTCSDAGSVVSLVVAGVRLRCTHLPPELAALPALEHLDLKCNALTGGIPREWTAAGAFPSLQLLNLADNLLTGTLADLSMAGGARMMASDVLNVSRNGFGGGPIPGAWRSPTLRVLDVSYNRVPGSLPAAWGAPAGGQRSALPALELLAVQGNVLEGQYDPWASRGGGTAVFASNFTQIVRPGNGLMEGVPAQAAPADQAANAAAAGGGGGGGLSAGAIAGICVAAAAAAALLALGGFVAYRRRRCAAKAAAEGLAGASAGVGALPLGKAKGDWSAEDPEAGYGGGDSAGGSAWSAGRGAAPAAAAAGSVRDSAMGSRSASGSGSGGSGSGGGGGAAADTDPRRLPHNWCLVEWGQLELGGVLGHGSFGEVRLAKYLHTTVAVKLLGGGKEGEAAADAAVIRQLEKEAAIMSQLRHTNVCLLMGACLAPPALVMEHCSRRSVDKLLSAGLRDPKAAKALSWGRLLAMALDAAKGMLYLHTRQPAVYHRDLKSANLLVTQSWGVKVADFNLSRALEEGGMSSVVIQNPRWLAPERLAGGAGGLPADVWSFGSVLWELMTWERPFDDLNSYQIIHLVQGAPSGSGLAVPPPDRLPAGPLAQYGAYVALMQACWARRPEGRPCMEEVAARLRAILAAEMGRTLPSSGGDLSGSTQLDPLEMRPSGSSPFELASAPGASPFEAAATAASGGPGAGPAAAGGSPFEAAAAAADGGCAAASPFAASQPPPADESPFSPFAAAAALPRQPSSAPLSPFEAAAARQPSVSTASPSPRGLSSAPSAQPAAAPPAAGGPEGPPAAAAATATAADGGGFEVATDSVLASFQRMEAVQRQLSRQASHASTTSPGHLSRAASGLGSGRRAPSRVGSAKGAGA